MKITMNKKILLLWGTINVFMLIGLVGTTDCPMYKKGDISAFQFALMTFIPLGQLVLMVLDVKKIKKIAFRGYISFLLLSIMESAFFLPGIEVKVLAVIGLLTHVVLITDEIKIVLNDLL